MTTQIWPVLHVVRDEEQAGLESARRAFAAGVAGVFVIQMEGDDVYCAQFASKLRALYPNEKIGVNFLSMPADKAIEQSIKMGMDATWSDSPGVSSQGASDIAQQIRDHLQSHPGHLFFGSVAFKYQKSEPKPGEAAQQAAQLGMIPTTSGAATGKAANIDKIVTMSDALNGGALGLASGVTPDNVQSFLPYATHILVATGIAETFYLLDDKKLERLMDNVRAFENTPTRRNQTAP